MRTNILLFIFVLGFVSAQAQSFQEYHERGQMFFSPEHLSRNVGTKSFCKDSIESYFGVSPITYRKGMVFYDFSKCPVGMKFTDLGICKEVSFRLFGNDGFSYIQEVLKSGFTKTGTRSVTLYDETFGVSHTTIKLYRKSTPTGSVVCEIMETDYTSFTFYKSR